MSASLSPRAYLDHNATAPLRDAARAAMVAVLDLCGNPSSIHAEGRAARAVLSRARGQVAALVGAPVDGVIFTASGSEANALALSRGIAKDGMRPERCLVSRIEHPSVLAQSAFAGDDRAMIPVGLDGVVDLAALAELLARDPRHALVSVMSANNETGVVQPIRAVADLVAEAGGLLHVDAVQTAGRVATDMIALGADIMTLSAHKIGGPKGVGALVIADPDRSRITDPLIKGGGQERNQRAGTENVPGIAGFGAAAEAALAGLDVWAEVARLRDALEGDLTAVAPDTVIFGRQAERLPNTICLGHRALSAETAVIGFDLGGVALSSGSACSSGKVSASHVLAAMGVSPDLAASALRISLGWGTTDADIALCRSVWTDIHTTLSRRKPRAA